VDKEKSSKPDNLIKALPETVMNKPLSYNDVMPSNDQLQDKFANDDAGLDKFCDDKVTLVQSHAQHNKSILMEKITASASNESDLLRKIQDIDTHSEKLVSEILETHQVSKELLYPDNYDNLDKVSSTVVSSNVSQDKQI